jgi:hypothetical protein
MGESHGDAGIRTDEMEATGEGDESIGLGAEHPRQIPVRQLHAEPPSVDHRGGHMRQMISSGLLVEIGAIGPACLVVIPHADKTTHQRRLIQVLDGVAGRTIRPGAAGEDHQQQRSTS